MQAIINFVQKFLSGLLKLKLKFNMIAKEHDSSCFAN